MAQMEEEQVHIPSEGRRLETPARDALLEHYARTDSISKGALAFEIIVIAGLSLWLLGRGLQVTSALPWLALALGGFGVFRWFLHHVFLNKKKLNEIRPDAQFGIHNRDSLLALTRRVFAQLGLKPDAAPVFVIRAKDVNAHAVRCELWPGLHLFNGVFLNRSILHLLDEPELASVVGHELGHVFPYAPLLSRCYLLHAAFAGIASFAITARLESAAVAILAPLAILWALDWVIAFPHLRLSRGIEFLCDDFGAHAAGLLPALSCEMKIAAEQETRQKLLLRIFEARQQGSPLNLASLAEAYEAAVPFGKADPQEFEREFQKFVGQKKSAAGRISLGGFLGFLQDAPSGAAEEGAEELAAELRHLQDLPLLPLDRSLYERGSKGWSIGLAERLTREIESCPQRVLFQLPVEVDDRTASHPNTTRRVLYLWRNQAHYPVCV